MIPLGDQYIELLGVVAVGEARASGYGRSLLRAIAHGDRLVRWSLRTDAIDAAGLTPRDRERFARWTAGADAPLRIRADVAPGLASVTVETADGGLTIGASAVESSP